MNNDLYNKEIEYIFNRFPSFQKVGGSAYKPGLETMELLDEVLYKPHTKFQSIHIAGTNGKGSTSHMIASALSMLCKPNGEPLKVGLYTSPHLLDFRERMKVSVVDKSVGEGVEDEAVGIRFEMPSKEFVYDFLITNKDDFIETGASFFEITTAMAFYWFEQQGVDIAVVECGLGGRLDATNIIAPQLSVITNIGLDHCEYLGNTVEAVAAEKAGIIKSGVPVVIGERSGVGEVFECKAAECGSQILFAEDLEPYRREISIENPGCNTIPAIDVTVEELDLTGACQVKNLRTVKSALATLFAGNEMLRSCLGYGAGNCADAVANSCKRVKYGICNAASITGLHGRWETLSQKPFIVCDTGHNAHGFAVLGEQIKKTATGVSKYTGRPFGRLVMFFGVVADKDLDSIAGFLPGNVNDNTAQNSVQYYFVNAAGTRALPAVELKEKMKHSGFEGEVLAEGNISAALDKYMKGLQQETDFVFIGGSTFVVAEALEYFKKL